MKFPQIIYSFLIALTLNACSNQNNERAQTKSTKLKPLVDQFADLRVIRYTIPGFENLKLKEKKIRLLPQSSRFSWKRHNMGSKLSP